MVALGVSDLAAEKGRGHFMGFVADDQVPIGVLELGLNVLIAAQFVEPGNAQ